MEARILLVVDADDPESVRERLALDPWTGSGLLTIASVEPWSIRLDRSDPSV